VASLLAVVGCLPACGGASSISLGPPSGPSIPVTPPAPPPLSPARYLAARWVRIAWAGAPGAPGTVTRTEAEAEALARQIALRVEGGESLGALAARYSDDASRYRGGELGTVPASALPPPLANALQAIDVERTAVVRTGSGWVVLQRATPQATHVRWAGWGYDGAARASASRPLAEATQMARDAGTAWQRGAPPSADAQSEAPEEVGAGQWPDPLDGPLRRLAPGEVSAPIVTEAGVYLLRREDEPAPPPP
jgi:hypothetical protein